MFGFGRKKDVFEALFGSDSVSAPKSSSTSLPVVAVNDLPASSPRGGWWHGEKFSGGMGPAIELTVDYWTLRMRSGQLFRSNMYAAGLIKRIVDNIIASGLYLEACPEERILGLETDSLSDWSEDVENRFKIWANSPKLCDYFGKMKFGEIQEFLKRESLIDGDMLVVLIQNPETNLPRIKLVNGKRVRTPFPYNGTAKIVDGVELDADGRQVAYWVTQGDNTSKRLPAFGSGGRRNAFLFYGSDMRRFDDVRGPPLLQLIMQSLRELDKFRDSVQRKAVINSYLAMFISKSEPVAGTRPLTSGAVRRGTDVTIDSSNDARSFRTAEAVPGLVIDELAQGERPEMFAPNGGDMGLQEFESAVLAAVAFSNGVPPEIYRLFFSNNYSASQAAINEWKIVIGKDRTRFGAWFCDPVYEEWLLAEVLLRKIKADGLVDAWRDPAQREVFEAWIQTDWTGQIKPAVDLSKLVRGFTESCQQGFTTRARSARETWGGKFTKNVSQLKKENEALADAWRPLLDVQQAMSGRTEPTAPGASSDTYNIGNDIDLETDDMILDRIRDAVLAEV